MATFDISNKTDLQDLRDLFGASIALDASATWDAASIADGDEVVVEVTVTGAALGDFCLASLSIDVIDLNLTAAVTAANTVTAQLNNNTGGAIDLASGTLYVRVIKRGDILTA